MGKAGANEGGKPAQERWSGGCVGRTLCRTLRCAEKSHDKQWNGDGKGGGRVAKYRQWQGAKPNEGSEESKRK